MTPGLPRLSFLLLLAIARLPCAAPPARAQEGSPAGPVPVELLAARRQALLDSLGDGLAIVGSAARRSLEGDYPQDSDYRETNDFFYLTGLEAPGGCLVLLARSGGADSVILYLPERDPRTERWAGVRPAPGPEASRVSGIADVRSGSRLEEELPNLARAASLVYLGGGDGRIGSALVRKVLQAGRSGPTPRVDDLNRKVALLRLIKDPDEQNRLRKAVEITGASLREAMAAARPGVWEYELEGLIEYGFRRRGAERQGFPSIVASGPNAATLHYDQNRRQTQDGDLVVLDVGAEFGYYSADVTRTVPVSGRFSDRQRRLYQLVLGAQQAAIAAIRPGATLGQLDRIARAWLRENSDGLCGGATCDRFFVHSLSHWLGMDVHDVGPLGVPLAPGMVLTVEPGIYLPEDGLGIRIEDDVLVTETGYEVLSREIPHTVGEIERAMGVP